MLYLKTLLPLTSYMLGSRWCWSMNDLIQNVVMTATTILHQNAIPVFADIDPDTLNIDPKDVERKITKRTKLN